MRSLRVGFFSVVLGALTPVALAGQIAWESPVLLHPYAPSGWSFFLADPHPGDEVAVIGAWRTAPVPVGLGFRAGLGEGAEGDVAVFAGADVTGALVERSEERPVDVIWFAGAGGSLAEDLLVSVPLGLTLGWEIDADGVPLRPHVGGHVVLDAWFGDREPGEGDDVELGGALDFGLDVALEGGWIVRFGGSVFDREALAIGIALPAPGRR